MFSRRLPWKNLRQQATEQVEQQVFSVRSAQLCLGLAYATLALVAILRLGNLVVPIVSTAMAIGAFLTARRVADVSLPWPEIWRVGGVGVIVLAIGAYAVALGGEHALNWAAVVLAYCAGNRIRASGYLRR